MASTEALLRAQTTTEEAQPARAPSSGRADYHDSLKAFTLAVESANVGLNKTNITVETTIIRKCRISDDPVS
jgi:hypothetical protein